MRIIPRKSINVSWEEFRAAARTLKRNQLIAGPEIDLFEERFASYIGVKHAIAISSARIGIWIIFKALGCAEEEEVILSSYNFPVIPAMLKLIGLKPVFVDINPYTYNINVDEIEEKITKNTKYILVTHLFGQPCDLYPVIEIAKKYRLKIVEDCAHACGSEYKGKKVGSFGDAGCFSFGIGKALVTFGGGMVTTNSDELYEKIKNIISGFKLPGRLELIKKLILGFVFTIFAKRLPYTFFVYPVNFVCNMFGYDLEELLDLLEDKIPLQEEDIIKYKIKFTNVQAAIGIEQLKKLEYLNMLRIRNSEMLTENLCVFKNIKIPHVIENVKHIYLYYPVKIESAKEFKKYLIKRGIDVKISSQRDCSSIASSSLSGARCIFAESIDNKILELPNAYNHSKKDIHYIIKVIGEFFKKKDEEDTIIKSTR